MSMLAERRRKTKWVINPTKKPLWTTDSEGIKFGKGLMEKMGWSAGKGLGANEQGIQEPLKVSYKNDTKGMGFKGNDDDWIEHQDEFNCFLNQLRNSDESHVVKVSDAEKNEVKSLEEKSKWSKARVHYQKFTRGKDLSKYSENDLACILGTNKTKNEKTKVEEVIQEESKSDNIMETNFGVTTINSGSIQDYFKKKWIAHKKPKNDDGDEAAQNILAFKDEENSKVDMSFDECVEMTDNLKKSKKKRKREVNCEDEIENKREKSDSDVVNGVSGVLSLNNDDCGSEKLTENVFECVKKKRKKNKELINEVGCDKKDETFEEEVIVKKKKKSKKENDEDKTESCDVLDPEVNTCSVVKKKKKKKDKCVEIENCRENTDVETELVFKKKTKEVEPILKEEEENKNTPLVEVVKEVESIRKKKKKKKDKTVSEEKTTTELENESEVQTKKKKHKKKDKKDKENLIKNENDTNEGNKNQIDTESEPVKKKKKKNKRDQKELIENDTEGQLSVELETFNTKKKKHKKEKLIKEEIVDENPIDITDKSYKEKQNKKNKDISTESCLEEQNLKNETANSLDKESEKKTSISHNNNNYTPQYKPPHIQQNNIIDNFLHSYNYNNNNMFNSANGNLNNENGVQNHKTELLNDKVADKFYPGQNRREKILRLIHLSDFSEFKGSNLDKLTGYGVVKKKFHKKPL